MSPPKKFKSTSLFLKIVCTTSFIVILIVSAFLFDRKILSIILLLVLLVPAIPFLFVLDSHYTVERGKVLKFETQGKSKDPVLSIPILSIREVHILRKKGLKTGMILRISPYNIDDIKIQIHEIEEFVELLIQVNPSIKIT